ncbi:MAG: hypothetical protein QOD94_1181 [Alphaproteobacteria bacterium]|nr:hypothetical protein [Alphaproteobacteria bacterium]
MPTTIKALLCRLRRGMMRCLAFLLAIPLLGPALAADNLVDLQLVLAIDASNSVSDERFELQKRGYVAAFRNPQVIKAIASGAEQSIAVTMMQWTGPFTHVQVVPWMRVRDSASASALADAINHSERELFGGGGTSISGAIDQGVMLLSQSPYKSQRRTIDISGDGPNSSGRSVIRARDEAVAQGIGINGLPILSIDRRLDHYYYSYVIGGPGAFMIPAANYESFAEAIVKKLILEIAANPPPAGPWGAMLARSR